jgi:hypothetical protein
MFAAQPKAFGTFSSPSERLHKRDAVSGQALQKNESRVSGGNSWMDCD